jgi:hypothetical protein
MTVLVYARPCTLCTTLPCTGRRVSLDSPNKIYVGDGYRAARCFCLRQAAKLSAEGLESTFWPQPPHHWKCLLWHIRWPLNMNDMNDEMNNKLIWHDSTWFALIWHDSTWFDIKYIIWPKLHKWRELHDTTRITWLNMIWLARHKWQ